MNKEIELLIQKNVLRDVEIKLLEAEEQGEIVSANIYSIIHDLEDNYKK